MFGIGAGELFLIFLIALLFLGPKKLPELAKGLGQAIREFQKAKDEMMSEINKPHDPSGEIKTTPTAHKDIEITPEGATPHAREVDPNSGSGPHSA